MALGGCHCIQTHTWNRTRERTIGLQRRYMSIPARGGTVELFFSWAWLIIVVWLIFRAFVQRGLLQRLIVKSGASNSDPPRLALIIPARNESANLGPCLASFLAQDYPASRLTIIVVDDHSSDGTAQLAKQMGSRTLV